MNFSVADVAYLSIIYISGASANLQFLRFIRINR